MDGIKEIYTAMQDRIKSPIIGSIIIALILANWKLLYVIIFVKMEHLDKFKYFDKYMDMTWCQLGKLCGLPIIAGLVFAVAKPWIDVGGAWLYGKPIYIKKSMEINDAIKLEETKTELEKKRVKNAELRLIGNESTKNRIEEIKVNIVDLEAAMPDRRDLAHEKSYVQAQDQLDDLKSELRSLIIDSGK